MTSETRPSPAAGSKEPSSGFPTWVVGITALALAGVVGVIIYGYAARQAWIGVTDKTFWDYLELLIVPAAIAIGVAGLNWTQNQRALTIQDQRSQDEALQGYLDQLTNLLLKQSDEGLIMMSVDDDVRQIIQARTEPLLRSLNAPRKWSLVLFLAGMELLVRDRSLISLAGADLRGVNGYGAPLGEVNLSEADLSNANLDKINLAKSDLTRANLREAHLSSADLQDALLEATNFQGADLQEADLKGTTLPNANFQNAHLRIAKFNRAAGQQVSFQGATLTGAEFQSARLGGADFQRAQLSAANLRGANLRGANLNHANLLRANVSRTNLRGASLREVNFREADVDSSVFEGANLQGANLWEAKLERVDFRNADLSQAKIDTEDLEKGALCLEGATMPNGQKYEDWLTSREEDGER